MRHLILTSALALSMCTPAYAQSNCSTRDMVVERLADKYGESRQSIGLTDDNRPIETWANEETGSWTITITMPDGITCLLASGLSYENLDELPQGKETDT